MFGKDYARRRASTARLDLLYRLVADMPEADISSPFTMLSGIRPSSEQLIDRDAIPRRPEASAHHRERKRPLLFDEAALPVITETHFGPRPTRFFPLGQRRTLLKHIEELRHNEEKALPRTFTDSAVKLYAMRDFVLRPRRPWMTYDAEEKYPERAARACPTHCPLPAISARQHIWRPGGKGRRTSFSWSAIT